MCTSGPCWHQALLFINLLNVANELQNQRICTGFSHSLTYFFQHHTALHLISTYRPIHTYVHFFKPLVNEEEVNLPKKKKKIPCTKMMLLIQTNEKLRGWEYPKTLWHIRCGFSCWDKTEKSIPHISTSCYCCKHIC